MFFVLVLFCLYQDLKRLKSEKSGQMNNARGHKLSFSGLLDSTMDQLSRDMKSYR